MPPPLPPNLMEGVRFPVFGMSWWADANGKMSVHAMCGGGGSARTGVHNMLWVQVAVSDDNNNNEEQELVRTHEISTGTQVGNAVHVYEDPIKKSIFLVIALGKTVQRFRVSLDQVIPDGEPVLVDSSEKDECVAIAVNGMGDRLAVGCESGQIYIYKMSPDRPFAGGTQPQQHPLVKCQGHEKSICAMAFSFHGGKLLSSARDGTARVWNFEQGQTLEILQCPVHDPTQPQQALPAKKQTRQQQQQQVLVRGCAVVDLKGHVFVTVACPRRGSSYLTLWDCVNGKYQIMQKTVCSPCPISSLSLSQDASTLALGASDGTVILWNIPDWKMIKRFPEVHDLPVTCLAVRPYPVARIAGEDNGVRVEVRCASADSKVGYLTLQRRVPKGMQVTTSLRKSNLAGDLLYWIHRLLAVFILTVMFVPIVHEAQVHCGNSGNNIFSTLTQCVVQQVLWAPPNRPGISVPPY